MTHDKPFEKHNEVKKEDSKVEEKGQEIPKGTFSPRPEDSPFRRVNPEVVELQQELDALKTEKGVKRDEEAEFKEYVGQVSVCGVCLQAFEANSSPVIEKSKDVKFNKGEVYSAVHSRCKDKPVRVYVARTDKNTPTKIVEVPVSSLDKSKE